MLIQSQASATKSAVPSKKITPNDVQVNNAKDIQYDTIHPLRNFCKTHKPYCMCFYE